MNLRLKKYVIKNMVRLFKIKMWHKMQKMEYRQHLTQTERFFFRKI